MANTIGLGDGGDYNVEVDSAGDDNKLRVAGGGIVDIVKISFNHFYTMNRSKRLLRYCKAMYLGIFQSFFSFNISNIINKYLLVDDTITKFVYYSFVNV